MKVTMMEEIEARKAWHAKMFCPQCDSFHYRIHHQLEPETSSAWWIECGECGYESYPSPSREIAILRWKQAHETNN